MAHFAKRHYEAIALTFQDARKEYAGNQEMIDAMVREFADMLARDNGQFKRGRFERACQSGANVRARS